jgi:hypothetical protein
VIAVTLEVHIEDEQVWLPFGDVGFNRGGGSDGASRVGSLIETGGRGTRGIDRENCRQRAAEPLASGVGEGEAR